MEIKEQIDLWMKIALIIFILMILFLIIWGINIVPKQMKFGEQCEKICLDKSMEFEVIFTSYPWNNVNGYCSCITKEEIDLNS